VAHFPPLLLLLALWLVNLLRNDALLRIPGAVFGEFEKEAEAVGCAATAALAAATTAACADAKSLSFASNLFWETSSLAAAADGENTFSSSALRKSCQ
jgi:hypothetical protein